MRTRNGHDEISEKNKKIGGGAQQAQPREREAAPGGRACEDCRRNHVVFQIPCCTMQYWSNVGAEEAGKEGEARGIGYGALLRLSCVD